MLNSGSYVDNAGRLNRNPSLLILVTADHLEDLSHVSASFIFIIGNIHGHASPCDGSHGEK